MQVIGSENLLKPVIQEEINRWSRRHRLLRQVARENLQKEAIDSAEPFLASCYRQAVRDGNTPLAAGYRQGIVNAHIAGILARERKK